MGLPSSLKGLKMFPMAAYCCTVGSADTVVTWTLEQEPGDVFDAGGLLSAGEHLFASGAHGLGTHPFAGSVALCGARRMGQADGPGSHSRSAHPAPKNHRTLL